MRIQYTSFLFSLSLLLYDIIDKKVKEDDKNISVKIGCDVVHIKRFGQSTRNGGEKFLDKIFLPAELANSTKLETRAGIFAAKEAIIKALNFLKAGDWQRIEIIKDKNGRPEIKFDKLNKEIISRDISISHDGEYAIAFVVFIISNR